MSILLRQGTAAAGASRSRKLLMLAGLAGSLFWASSASAVTVSIGLQEAGVNAGAITTEATGTNSLVSFAGSYGSFTSNGITATGNPPLTGNDLLNSTTLNIASTTAGVLNVYVTAQGITGPIGAALGFLSSFTENQLSAGITSVLAATYLDAGNGLFTTTTALSSHLFTTIATALGTATGNTGAGPYSVTELFTITSSGGGTASSTTDLSATPLPPAIVLFGTALAGLGVFGRRRRKVSLAAA